MRWWNEGGAGENAGRNKGGLGKTRDSQLCPLPQTLVGTRRSITAWDREDCPGFRKYLCDARQDLKDRIAAEIEGA